MPFLLSKNVSEADFRLYWKTIASSIGHPKLTSVRYLVDISRKTLRPQRLSFYPSVESVYGV